MRTAAVVLLLALAACQKTEPAPPPTLASVSPAMPVAEAAPTTKPTPVLGWTTDGGDFLLLGRQAPAFTAKLLSGAEFGLEKLRDHWTIVGFRDISEDDKTESTFASALNSAAEQDPDLDYLEVVVAPAPSAQNPGASRTWIDKKIPTLLDADQKISSAFGVMDTPMYLLIGPDLTIEAMRGPLSETPDNGIKDVIRGVAEVRKQIANPT